MHEFVEAKKIGKKNYKFAIVDGKQRLEALWGFINGDYPLDSDFEYIHDKSVKAAGLSYGELGSKYPHLKSKFDSTSLSVVSIRTNDIELIEDMFLRLNEAMPLNAPEKRNGFPPPMPKIIRELATHDLFQKKLGFTDRRFKHRDLAAKFLMIEYEDRVVDTKKTYLDEFVRNWAGEGRTAIQAQDLSANVQVHLGRMERTFNDDDSLLRSVGMAIVIYHLFRFLDKLDQSSKICREHFELFETARIANRIKAEEELSKADYDLLEFDKYVQTPNDAFATRLRLAILVRYLRDKARLSLPRKHKYFDVEG